MITTFTITLKVIDRVAFIVTLFFYRKELIIILTIIKNGYSVDLEQLGLECIDFIVESLNPEHSYSKVQGQDGYANIETTYNGRTMRARFYLQANDNDDFINKRDEIYKLFRQRNQLTLIDERQPYKKWNAQVESAFTISEELSPSNAIFEVQFISKTIYAFGDEVTVNKETSTNKFIVFNDGDFEIDGKEHHLLITFTGQSHSLRIRNNMNNTQWQYYDDTDVNDTLTLERVYPYKNNINIFDDTNAGYIILERGSNEIELFGATGDYDISFKFIPLYI